MSADALPPIVPTITSRFRQLLAKARTIKPTTSIEPPLPFDEFRSQISNISSPKSDSEIQKIQAASPLEQGAVGTGARDLLFEKIRLHDIQDPGFIDVWNLLDLVVLCVHHVQCDFALPLTLVEEMLDTQTIDGCRYILDYLKSRLSLLLGGHKDVKALQNKRLTILRTCNELLRRLSRAEDAVFCGDVFVFLFKVFPLGDKSAVNLRGDFHVENTTSFDPPEPKPEPMDETQEAQKRDEDQASMQNDRGQKEGIRSEPAGSRSVDNDPAAKTPGESTQDVTPAAAVADDGAPGEGHDDKTDQRPRPEEEEEGQAAAEHEVPASRDLYPEFWGLQHMFSNPRQAFDAELLTGFKKGLEATLRKFKATPKIPRVATPPKKRKRDEDVNEFASTFNPKYLTSRDLFDLELSDLTFQRHILVQTLILLEFLLSLTPEAKEDLEDLKPQRSMVYDYTLSEEDKKWCLDMKNTASGYLQEGPDGKFYHRMVDNVLSRDKNWLFWKIEQCQNISLDPVPPEMFTISEQSLKRASKPRPFRGNYAGALDLDFFDADKESAEDRWKSLTSRGKTDPPDMASFAKEVQTSELDLEMVDKESEAQEWLALVNKRGSQTWQALHIAAEETIGLFATVDEAKGIDFLVEGEQPQRNPDAENGTTDAASEVEMEVQDGGLDLRDEMPNGINGGEVDSTMVTANG